MLVKKDAMSYKIEYATLDESAAAEFLSITSTY